MRLVISTDDPTDLEPLYDWLAGEPELSVRKQVSLPRPGELGAVTDALLISAGSGGALTVLAASLRGLLQQPRWSKIKLSVRRDADGAVTAEIDADRVRASQIEALLARIVDKG
ncbi:hypothetical protein AB0G02_02555 [Actinosynnema sp. NPDC023658]|uniref:effector-associated constant component EACC1 n=1 Tax=Actinosynnema sp. NPDC023658 TaxID=3155465 RepID=UPI0033C0681C